MKRYFHITVLCILLCVLVIGCITLTACRKQEEDYSKVYGKFYSQWMQHIADDTPVHRIAIPGSHDAGTVGMNAFACTQSNSIYAQLLGGVRYFDTRVMLKGNDAVIFHGIVTGEKFEPIAQSFEKFLQDNPSEFVIIDFQKIGAGASSTILSILQECGLNERALTLPESMEQNEWLRSLTMGEVRGKVLLTWGETDGKPTPIPSGYENMLFRRNNDGCTLDDSVLDSLYEGDLHHKSSTDFIDQAMPIYQEHGATTQAAFWVLQCQLTGGHIERAEVTHNPNMQRYLDQMMQDETLLSNVNIVMRDFICDGHPTKVQQILHMNVLKGYVADDAKELFAYTSSQQ